MSVREGSGRLPPDRNNVADQPGLAILLTGLFISLVLGLSFRGLLNPAKIRAQVESAAARIHPDLKVSFEDAHVSLAQGLLPRLAVVIRRVRMESSNPCWLGPRLIADEIRLPISITGWLVSGAALRQVEAGDVELRLTQSRPASCDLEGGGNPATSEKTTASSGTSAPGPVVTLVKRENHSDLKNSGEIEGVDIERLSIVSEADPKGSLDLERVEFRVRSNRPRVFHLKARTYLLKDETVGEYLSSAQLDAEYKEFPEKILDLRVSGNWREGSYNLIGRYALDSDHFRLDGELRHLPLSQLLQAMKKSTILGEGDFNPRLSWLSFKAEAEGKGKDLPNKVPVTLRDLRLEGDLGDILAEKILVDRLDPLHVAPSRLEVRKLDFDRLLQFLGKSHPSPFLNHIGRFAGWVDIKDDQNFKMIGEHSGLEFIFSNKGQREVQTVNALEGEFSRDKGRWNISVRRGRFEQGDFDGQASMNADSEFHEVDLRFRTERMSLAPAVRRLMTRGGDIAPLASQMQVHFKNGHLSALKGNIKIPHVSVEGLDLENLQAQFDEKNGEILFSPRIERMSVPVNSAGGSLMQTALPAAWTQPGEIVFNSVSGQFRTKELNQIRWSKVNGRIDAFNASINSDGGWNAEGVLDGRLSVRGKGEQSAWKITGSRDQPVLQKVTP